MIQKKRVFFEEGNDLAGRYYVQSMVMLDPYGMFFPVPWVFGECIYDVIDDEVEFGVLEDGNREFTMRFRIQEICFGETRNGERTLADIERSGIYNFEEGQITVALNNNQEINMDYVFDGVDNPILSLNPIGLFFVDDLVIVEMTLWPMDDTEYCE